MGIEEYPEALDHIAKFIELVEDPELRAHALERQALWQTMYRPVD